jgi:hypothetical protein
VSMNLSAPMPRAGTRRPGRFRRPRRSIGRVDVPADQYTYIPVRLSIEVSP